MPKMLLIPCSIFKMATQKFNDFFMYTDMTAVKTQSNKVVPYEVEYN